MDEKTKELALSVAAEGIKDLNAYAQALQIPGLATMLAIGAFIIQRWELHKFESMLDHYRSRLDLTREGLAQHLNEHRGERWLTEGLARGWKAIQETMDPIARQCSELMVGDYLLKKESPDRYHRQFGNLFMESDATILSFVEQLASFCDRDVNLSVATIFEGTVGGVGGIYVGMESGPPPARLVTPFEQRQTGLEMVSILIRNCMAVPWQSYGHPQPAGGGMFIAAIEPHMVGSWKRLRSYLKPVHGTKPAT